MDLSKPLKDINETAYDIMCKFKRKQTRSPFSHLSTSLLTTRDKDSLKSNQISGWPIAIPGATACIWHKSHGYASLSGAAAPLLMHICLVI